MTYVPRPPIIASLWRIHIFCFASMSYNNVTWSAFSISLFSALSFLFAAIPLILFLTLCEYPFFSHFCLWCKGNLFINQRFRKRLNYELLCVISATFTSSLFKDDVKRAVFWNLEASHEPLMCLSNYLIVVKITDLENLWSFWLKLFDNTNTWNSSFQNWYSAKYAHTWLRKSPHVPLIIETFDLLC